MKQISKQPIPSQFADKSHTFLFSMSKWCQQNPERQKYYPKNYIERYRHNHKHKLKHYFTPLFPFSHSTTFSAPHQCFSFDSLSKIKCMEDDTIKLLREYSAGLRMGIFSNHSFGILFYIPYIGLQGP